MFSDYSTKTGDCIIIDRNPTFYKISSWKQGIRFWRNEGAGFRPWLPLGQVLDQKGNPVIYPDQYDDQLDPIGMEDDVTGELEPILKRIPEKIRKLAVPFRANQWLALDAMCHLEGFSSFIEMELSGIGSSFILACWELAGARRRSLAERRDLNRRIMTIKRNSLISLLTDMPCGTGFVRALPKLEGESISREVLLNLLDCVQNPKKAQAIAMTERLYPSLIESILQLPDWLTFPAIINALGEMGEELRGLGAVFPPRILNAPAEYHDQIAQSLRNVTDINQLESRIANWSQRIFLDSDFPDSPIPGNRLLTPIRNGEELRIEGEEMSHCVAGYAEEVAEGFSFFYRWLGQDRATVQLVKNEAGHWGIEEHLGKRNAHLSPETIQEITLVVASQMKGGLFLFETHVAGTQYYQASAAHDEIHQTEKQPVIFKREPDNQYDKLAIEVFTGNGVKLGYVPRQRNSNITRLMDSGHQISGYLTRFIDRGRSGDIRMELFLTGKHKNEAEMCVPKIIIEEPSEGKSRIIPMIGGITAKLDESSQSLLLTFG
jgi:hypothetical protein